VAGLTALQLAVPAADPMLDRLRGGLPPGSTVLDPAHISLGYPWLAPEVADEVIDDVAAALADMPPVTVTLHGPRRFGPDRRGRTVIYLDPRPGDDVVAVAAAVGRASGRPPAQFVPHCSVLRLGPQVDPQPWEREVGADVPLEATLDTVHFHVRDRRGWRRERTLPLGGDPQRRL
jgi:2'-5' RNA ligase